MSKTLRTVGMVVAAVALVATGVGALAGAGVFGAAAAGSAGVIAGMSVATISAIGTYASIAAGVISAISAATAPGFSAQGSASTFRTNPQSGLPYAMGRTRMSGLRCYARTYDGFKQQSKDDILAFVALLTIAGPIQEIERFTADNEVVSFAAGGNAVGHFNDYMGQQISFGAKSGPALGMTFGGKPFPQWTAQHKLSGMAHAQWAMRFDTKGNLYGAGAPEPAWVGKWVLVYDPRLDSTYPGGSGSCRPLQEDTYVWSDNPGLHALTWSLGRWLNGKRVCGIGAPVENIRLAEFVECANVCEANDWKVGGVEWTTDSKWDTLKRILQAGGAVPTKTGAMIGCMVSTPRTAIATIESRHLHDGASFPMTKSRRDRFNTVIPRYVDEDSDWAVVSGKAVSEPVYVTADGGQRTKEIDFPLVQVFSGEEAKQPGQLAAYAIVDSREAGPWTFSTGPEWLGLKTGDVVYLNVPEEGIANQPVLITRRSLDPASAKVSFTVQTETYAKHAYALGETTVPPAPFSLTAPALRPAAPLALNWNVAGTTSGEGFPALLVTGESQHPSADAVFIDYRRSGTDTWTSSAILSAIDPVSHVIAPLESQSAYDVRIGYRIGTIDGDVTIFTNVTTGLGKVTLIDGKLDQAVTRIDAAQAAIDFIDDQVADIIEHGDATDTRIENIEVLAGQNNLLPNSDFAGGGEGGKAGWGLYTASPDKFAWGVDPDFTVPGEHCLGLLCQEHDGELTAVLASDWVAIEEGNWLQASCWVAARECVNLIRLQWGDGAGNYMGDGAASEDVYHPYRGWGNLDGFKRVWCKDQAPPGARFVRLQLAKGPFLTAGNPQNDLSWLFAMRPMLAYATSTQTAPSPYQRSGGGTVLTSARARIEDTRNVAVSAGEAAAQAQQNLNAAAGDINARLNITSAVAARAADRTAGAMVKLEAFAGNARGQLALYAFDQDGNARAGVDLVGDLTIRGDVFVDGTVYTTKLAPNAAQSIQWVRTASTVNLPFGTQTRIAQLAFQKFEPASTVDLLANIRMKSNDDLLGVFRLINLNNGAIEDTWPIWMIGVNNNFQVPITLNWMATGWETGSYTLAIDFISQEDDAPTWAEAGSTIKIQEIKRGGAVA